MLVWLLSSALLAAPASSAAVSTTTLVVCDDVQDPPTLDPHKQFSEKNHTLLQQIYEGLVRFNAEGQVEPALAVSWERKSPLRMRFHLRQGVRFHNGAPFDSNAVVFSITRYLDPATAFPALGFISSIEKAEAVDSHTVDIITRYPDGLLLNRLAGFILIIAPDFIREHGEQALQTQSVGTGPFKLNRWERRRAIYLDRNPDYWMQGYPKVEHLVFDFLPAEKQFEKLKNGEIDVTTELPGTLTMQAAQTGHVKVVKNPSFYAVTGSFNTSRGPLQNLLVRQALNYAVNRPELIRYDQLGNGRELATVTMAGEEGHNDALKPYPFDLAKARKLLKEAGYAKGFTLRVLVKLQGVRAAQILAKQFEKIGVALEQHPVTDAEIMDALKGGNWDMILAGCPDPMATSFFIQSIFLFSKSPYALAANPEYDARLGKMASTLDDAERSKAGQELDQYIYDQALMLFLYQRIKTHGVREDVSFSPSVTGMPYFFNAQKEAVR